MVGIDNGGWCHSCNGSIELTYCLISNYHLDYGIFEDHIRICIRKNPQSAILKLYYNIYTFGKRLPQCQ